MSFLRRVFGWTGRDERAQPPPDEPLDDSVGAAAAEFVPTRVETPAPPALPAPIVATCPSCGYLLDPPPPRDRRCPSCRQRIIVRRTDGRLVHLTEGAVVVFDRERRRMADEARWGAERDWWLTLAASVDAAPARISQLGEAGLSEDVVAAARDLYETGADRSVKAAKRAKRWNDVARIRREEAAALFHAAGNPIPPPTDVVALHREGMLAELRALAVTFKDAELVGARCCRPCRTGDGKAFRIADELRAPRLPHEGCPKGLCGCEWWLAMPGPKPRRRARRPTAGPHRTLRPSSSQLWSDRGRPTSRSVTRRTGRFEWGLHAWGWVRSTLSVARRIDDVVQGRLGGPIGADQARAPGWRTGN